MKSTLNLYSKFPSELTQTKVMKTSNFVLKKPHEIIILYIKLIKTHEIILHIRTYIPEL